jgi:hypothetical protein
MVERDMLYVGSQVGSHAMLVLAAKRESPVIMEPLIFGFVEVAEDVA